MSTFSQMLSISGGSGKKLKFQYFTSSGTFTPTSALIAAGGNVMLDIRGGGGGGSYGATYNTGGSGGSSCHITPYQIIDTTPITVIVGAAGANSTIGGVGTSGGSSTFGTLTIDGGSGASPGMSGSGAGNNGHSGSLGFWASNYNFTASFLVNPGVNSTTPGSGSGGGVGGNPTSGSVMIVWWE